MRQAIGALLQYHGLITDEQLQRALYNQRKSGGRIGEILIAEGLLTYPLLYRNLARQGGFSYVNMKAEPPDAKLCEAKHVHDYISLQALPWRKNAAGYLLVASAEPENPLLIRWLNAHYGEGAWRVVLTSPFDIRSCITKLFAGRLTTESKTLLYALSPERSARMTLNEQQKISLVLLLVVFGFALLLSPWMVACVFIIGSHILYAVTMLLKGTIFQVGRHHAVAYQTSGKALPDHLLPIYTILVPLYREKRCLKRLFRSLERLDYPKSKLDIKLILESDDGETIRAVKALKPTYNYELIYVPVSKPRTKPKACNYALKFAKGKYVTIYDAEDRPARDQLKKAVAAFNRAPQQVICLQAKLRYYNADEKWLTRMFELEYRILFDTLLPGMQKLGIPLPLGGTSNHFDLSALRALGAWDPYNVTEDADLGVRISAAGFKTQMLDSYTWEEAPISLDAWIKQRSRWIKGYMQTWCVHMRKPYRLLKEIGVVPFLGLQFFIGISTLTFLNAPLVWGVSFGLWLSAHTEQMYYLPDWFYWLSLFNLFFYLALQWQQAFVVLPKKKGKRTRFKLAAITFPVYWLLHSIASYRALWQLIVRPHFWEKTMHGVSHYNEGIIKKRVLSA